MSRHKVIHLQEIQLQNGKWSYDPSDTLGPEGGFGIVYKGSSEKYGPIAVKKLKVTAAEGAHRELDIATLLAGHEFEHVIPFLDSGQDAESGLYFVVMPIADKSLDDEIMVGGIQEERAISILLEIAKGLKEASDFVHRDLKPGNVLFHNGKWKLADFGIAKFVERSTSRRTLKECLSPHFAAPEQWRLESSTSATDIYALGCVAYELLTGDPPFVGDDLREQHLHSKAPDLEASPKLVTLVRMMLRKPAESRPRIDRVISLLEQNVAEADVSGAAVRLAEAGEQIENQRAEVEAEREVRRTEVVKRTDLARHAYNELKEIAERLSKYLEKSSPIVTRAGAVFNRTLTLGGGSLRLQADMEVVGPKEFPRSGWDVVAYGAVGVSQAKPEYNWWSSLWFTNRGKTDEDFRWYEVSYFVSPLVGTSRQFEPFHLSDDFENADLAMSNTMATMSKAFGPVPIDDENEEAFFDRWANLLAKAAKGELCYPRSLPLRM